MPAIKINNVSKKFGALSALDNISFEIGRGEFFGLLGANGAGKSTLINIIAGLTHADSGVVRVYGFDVKTDFMHSRRILGIVPQELVYDPFFTVREMLRLQSGFFGCTHNDDWIDEILFELKLDVKADDNIQALSGGMKRRVLIAQALVHKPPVLILDEPTAGVDVELRRNLWDFVRKLNQNGHTIVLTTHYLEEAEKLCDRIGVLHNGHLLALDHQSKLLAHEKYLDVSVSMPKNGIPDWLRQHQLITTKNKITVRVAKKNDGLSLLVAKLIKTGINIGDLQIKRPSLEDVFVGMLQEDKNL